jgi:hypothetical protein
MWPPASNGSAGQDAGNVDQSLLIAGHQCKNQKLAAIRGSIGNRARFLNVCNWEINPDGPCSGSVQSRDLKLKGAGPRLTAGPSDFASSFQGPSGLKDVLDAAGIEF